MTLLKEINGLGYLQVGYSLLKALGWQPAIVLSRLITEYNYANAHGNSCLGIFIIINELAASLGMNENEIIDALNKLQNDYGFINIKEAYYKNRYKVSLNREEIINYIKNVEYEEDYKSWDADLNRTQRPKEEDFNCSREVYSHAEDLIYFLMENGCSISRIQKSDLIEISLEYYNIYNENITDNSDLMDIIKQCCNEYASNFELVILKVITHILAYNANSLK